MIESQTIFDGRQVFLLDLGDIRSIKSAISFAVLMPAYSDEDLRQVLSEANYLIQMGCKEFCCVGARAELLHDQLDHLIEKAGLYYVATTWHSDENDASEYFLFGAGGQKLALYALVKGVPGLVDALEKAMVAK